MKTLKVSATITDLGIEYPKPDARILDKFLSLPNHIGQEINVIIQPRDKCKTPNQLGYYWGHLIPEICKTIGENNEEYIHYCLKQKFLTKFQPDARIGKYYVRDLSRLNRAETSEFINKVYHYGIELGADVHPADNWWKGY